MSAFMVRLSRWRRRLAGAEAGVFLLGLLGAGALTYLILAGHVRAAVALGLTVGLAATAMVRIQAAICAAVIYLVLMGDVRRLLIPWAGWSGTDPLLLVGPAFAVFLCAYAWASRDVEVDTWMGRAVLALMVVMVLQIFNPRQGGLMVGVAGALFYVVPLLWYWIGRTYATPAFMKTLLYRVILPLAVLAALFGYYQTFYGYLPYQQQWYEIAGYIALGPAGKQAPISFFASSAEHSMFLVVATMLIWAVVLRDQNYAALALLPFFIVLSFLGGTQSPVVMSIAVGAVLWAVQGKSRKSWMVRGTLALVVGFAGLYWSVTQVATMESSSQARVKFRVENQTESLLNPTDKERSTMPAHFYMMVYGVVNGFRNPLGGGLGSTTKAASKFGGGSKSAEVDFSNVFLATGVVGGGLYVVVIFLAVRAAVRYWHFTRSLLALALIAVLTATFRKWLAGGQYAIASLVWICIGALDRMQNIEKEE
jgi:hypothetical protein